MDTRKAWAMDESRKQEVTWFPGLLGPSPGEVVSGCRWPWAPTSPHSDSLRSLRSLRASPPLTAAQGAAAL